VTGLVCRGLDPEALADATYLLAGYARQPPGRDERIVDLMIRTHEEVRAALHGDSFEFGLLLPDDETAMTERAGALAQWCQGFALGLLHGDLSLDELPDEAAEAARDIVEIAALDEDAEQDEDSERALTEIEQYLRVAVQLVYEELAAGCNDTEASKRPK
jgi:uncharacterized protein YgfB (UPF0149 family)